MPEKTLKESTFAKASVDKKVERARKALKRIEDTSEAHLDYTVHEEVSDRLAEIEEALTALEGKLKEYEELYEDPCHAECVINEDIGKREWLLHVPKDPPEPMEGDIQLKADYYAVGTRVCIYEPIKEAPSDGK